jgi:hypothetical protein
MFNRESKNLDERTSRLFVILQSYTATFVFCFFSMPFKFEPEKFKLVQGDNSLYTVSLSAHASSALVSLETDGLPLMAQIELWQGPDNTPQKLKVYNDQGLPFQIMVETPGPQCTIAIRNIGPLTFPLHASVAASLEPTMDS